MNNKKIKGYTLINNKEDNEDYNNLKYIYIKIKIKKREKDNIDFLNDFKKEFFNMNITQESKSFDIKSYNIFNSIEKIEEHKKKKEIEKEEIKKKNKIKTKEEKKEANKEIKDKKKKLEENIIINEYIDLCGDCKEELIINKDGLLVCRKCGSTHNIIVDHTAEWRYYGYNDNKSSDPTRCGLPINYLLPQSSLGSIISPSFRNESYEMKKIRKYHTWNSIPYKERALQIVFELLTRAQNKGIPLCIIEESKYMYKIVSEVKISRGSNRRGLIAACMYIACKKAGYARSAKEIADLFEIDITIMTNGCKNFIEIWNNINKNKEGNIILNASQSDDFIYRFCSKLNLSSQILNLCIHISKKAEQFSLVSENTPPSIAAGSIFLACSIVNINISKKDIANVCKISEVTISKCYKKLFKYQEHLLEGSNINTNND